MLDVSLRRALRTHACVPFGFFSAYACPNTALLALKRVIGLIDCFSEACSY